MTTSPIIDFHSHVLDREVLEQTMLHNVASGFGTFPPYAPGSRFAVVQAKMMNLASHIEDMDRLGIDDCRSASSGAASMSSDCVS